MKLIISFNKSGKSITPFSMHPTENEVIFPRNIPLRIVSIDDTDSPVLIKLEEA